MFKKLILPIMFCMATAGFSQESHNMLVGTYTRGTVSKGIYSLTFSGKGKFISQKLLAESDNPSYLAFSPDRKFVYAVNEHGEESTISAFAFDKANQTLTFINKVPAAGADPCYITVSDKHVFTANYSGGSISVFHRLPNGKLSEASQVITHPRKNFGNRRYGPSNAHQIIFSPDGKYLMATNLGTDRVFTYKYNPESDDEVLSYVDETGVKRASGPRHLAFSRNGKFLYLVQELNAGITVFSVSDDGKLSVIQETTLVTDSTKKNGAADIHLSPDGKFLYATNRGEANTITCFLIKNDGKLRFVEEYSTFGNAPRNFTITVDGKYLFVGNQKTNNITVYIRNRCSGKLKLLDDKTELGAPVCLVLY